jgi:hypothetical protein
MLQSAPVMQQRMPVRMVVPQQQQQQQQVLVNNQPNGSNKTINKLNNTICSALYAPPSNVMQPVQMIAGGTPVKQAVNPLGNVARMLINKVVEF